MKRIYVAGPMTGLPSYNFPAFFDAEERLERQGWIVHNPARKDVEAGDVVEVRGQYRTTETFSREKVLAKDVRAVTICDAIAMLPGWEESSGARLERSVAEACGLDVYLIIGGELLAVVKPRIIGLSGYGRAGKDTAGLALAEIGYERVAFADALKDVAAACFETDRETVNLAKNQPDDPMRGFLQRLGVAVRENVATDAWVQAGMLKCEGHKRVVITDVRFPNEARAIKNLGGQVWRIRRPGYNAVNGHISETALDDWDFDNWVYNDGSIVDFQWTVIRDAQRWERQIDEVQPGVGPGDPQSTESDEPSRAAAAGLLH